MALSLTKKILYLLIIVTVIIIIHHILYFKQIFWTVHQNYFSKHHTSEQWNPHLINTWRCSIPKTAVMPKYFQRSWRTDDIPDCSYEIKNFFLSDDEKSVTFLPRTYNEKCCVREIQRVYHANESYSLSPCEYTSLDFANVDNKEMFAVVCNSSMNFEAVIPMKPSVEKKLTYWSNREKPPNILILGIDSISRLHAHRSIPNTLALLKRMNFLEFKGYHSAGSSTIKNLLPLLTGMDLNEIRQTCATNWTTPFDDCPFIWKDFNALNYVTNFLEDGEGSFNWGGLGGFREPPTDYYIRPLFQALQEMREASFMQNATWWTKQLFTNCISTESVPEFLLRYTRQFTEKFFNVPFFSLTWLAYPFHENLYTLSSIDDILLQFFGFFRDYTHLLDNTVIIFTSDHGDRTSFFQSSSVEGFIERSLPPLFIRIPPKFRALLPFVHLNAMKNTKQLTTPLDLHQTLLHIAKVFVKEGNHLHDFNSEMYDRASLFDEIPKDRDCETVNIPLKNCVCDTVVSDMIANTPIFLREILRLVTFELNGIVARSKYRENCERWTTRIENVLSFRYLGRVKGKLNYLIVFVAEPGSAHFEARFFIKNEERGNLAIELIDHFSRVNSYKNQSSCIGFETDWDKEMKQFCNCKR